ncbi:MAG: Maf family protein [Schaedlerella sp.]|nr:Maf family protein [Schaedlerella sp.]
MKRIILGSASPRRKELLEQIGIKFEIKTSNKEERYTSEIPEEIVKELALQKAENVAEDMQQGALKNTVVIGADTIVAQDHEILGKPKDEEDAYRMISNLQGRAHQVFTGTALLVYDENGEKTIVNHAVETKVYVNEMSREEIEAYIAGKEPMDKAGAYGIQGSFAAYINRIEGDYYNVVGLPISYLYQELKKADAV